MMVLDEFIATLATLRHLGWQVGKTEFLRDRDGRCPIVTVAHGTVRDVRVFGLDLMDAILALDLTSHDSARIMNAADNFLSDDDDRRSLRNRMLEAVGLPKEGG